MRTRRDFLSSAARVPLAAAAGLSLHHSLLSPTAAAAQAVAIDAGRLRSRIEGISVFGRRAGGSFADGVSRVAYSQADIDARRYVSGLMREAVLDPRIDAAGNIIGRRAGTEAGLPEILFGSHIDSVPNGGNFDGVLGTMAALEVMQALDGAGVRTRHPLAMVVWQNEEGVAFNGGLCGSRAAAGEFPEAELDQVWDGLRMADAIRRIGGDPARLATARRPAGSTHCYLELHIEQGGTLDRAGVPIGIVEGIVGIDRYEATVRGVPNHAGTTAMADRHDALVAASHLVLAVNEIVKAEPGRQVGTVGQLTVAPNAPNVVPGQVTLTVELRDLSSEKVARLYRAVEAKAAAIARATGTEITFASKSHHEPALADAGVVRAIADAAAQLNLKTMRLPSGAGHDAQMASRFAPMGMIFVPSIGGISHSPKESTGWEDCARGAAVLLHAVLAADRGL
jgi:N-carbamoyl-L-amino-acid hydrolase